MSLGPGPRRDDGTARPCYPAAMAAIPDETATPRKIANLALIWRFTARYKGHVAGALLALLVAAVATLAIPSAFKLIIDRGFAGSGGDIGRWFQYLLMIVVVHGDRHRASLLFRLLARRAGRRRRARGGAAQPAPPRAQLLRGEPAVGDRLAAHRRHDDHRAGGRHHHLGGAAQHRHGDRRDRLSVRLGAEADRDAAARNPARRPPDRVPRPPHPQRLALEPGPGRRGRRDGRRGARRDEDRPGLRPGGARGEPLRRGGRASLPDRAAADHPSRGDDRGASSR